MDDAAAVLRGALDVVGEEREQAGADRPGDQQGQARRGCGRRGGAPGTGPRRWPGTGRSAAGSSGPSPRTTGRGRSRFPRCRSGCTRAAGRPAGRRWPRRRRPRRARTRPAASCGAGRGAAAAGRRRQSSGPPAGRVEAETTGPQPRVHPRHLRAGNATWLHIVSMVGSWLRSQLPHIGSATCSG